MLIEMPSMKATNNKCCICNANQRKLIPLMARVDVWLKINVYIPVGNRTCSEHLSNSLFKSEILPSIEAQRSNCELDEKEVANWFNVLKKIIELKKNPVNFDSMGGWSDNDIYSMLGVSKENFGNLYIYIKPYMNESKKRSIRNCLALFLMKIRLNLSQNVLAVLFGLSGQPAVSRIIKGL